MKKLFILIFIFLGITLVLGDTSGVILNVIDCVPNSMWKVSINKYDEIDSPGGGSFSNSSNSLAYAKNIAYSFQGSTDDHEQHFISQLILNNSKGDADYINIGCGWDTTDYNGISATNLKIEDLINVWIHNVETSTFTISTTLSSNYDITCFYSCTAMNNTFTIIIYPKE